MAFVPLVETPPQSTLPPPDARTAEAPVRGDAIWRAGDAWAQRFENLISRAVPAAMNPFLQTGAIANLCLLVACISGAVLLIWYVPSVHQAHASLEAMQASPWTAQLIRSLHRYSSDGAMLFVLVHALRLFVARRFTGARWLPWVTGLVALAMMWVVGWLGYWLVWDQAAQQVALGSARVLDVLPVFIDPLSRSFLADATVNSLLFFVVFFAHMLLPVAMGVALWLHIARLARARFLTQRPMTLWVLGSLTVLSLVHPAVSAAPARMAVVPESFRMDWWYLLPMTLTDRLSGGMLWAIVLVGGGFLLTIPWWMRKGRLQPASVEVSRCNSCNTCAKDCPYGAITMVARTDGRNFSHQAQVDPARCVGCGICAGSCDSAGIGIDWFSVVDWRMTIDQWLEDEPGAAIVFGCTHSAAGGLQIDGATGKCAQAPGMRVLLVPCAGWVHALSIERAQRHGAREVVVVGCGTGNCHYREGGEWAHQRIDGARKPFLRPEKADRSKVRMIDLGAGGATELLAVLRGAPAPGRRGRVRAGMVGVALAAGFSGLTWLFSSFPYRVPATADPELVVSFKHPGQVQGGTRQRSAEELAKLPPHMRQAKVVERERASVRLRVVVDGKLLHAQAYSPTGIWKDGNSIAIERFPLAPGKHSVELAIGETADPNEWTHVGQHEIDSRVRERRVVTFERAHGFLWY